MYLYIFCFFFYVSGIITRRNVCVSIPSDRHRPESPRARLIELKKKFYVYIKNNSEMNFLYINVSVNIDCDYIVLAQLFALLSVHTWRLRYNPRNIYIYDNL